ncbi:MAG TPA: NAD(P)/FAD-dependent oxidoreductase [Rhizomicrobium sp.]|nr:NAD(P)/FAD-dependent oxidoreductase [Rhizomicrobium sp.]
MARYDLIVVGGSFAGLACARTAALRGLKVAVLDAKDEPGARVRTTGILVKEATDDSDLPSSLMRKVPGVRLYAPNGRSLDLHAPGYFFQSTNTAGLLRWMAEEASRAGARLYYGYKFENGSADDLGVSLPGFSAHYLIGADGARSRVADVFDLGRNRRFLVGAEIECEPVGGMDTRFLHCFADSAIAPGYIGWAVPGHGMVQIGVAAKNNRKPDLAQLTARLSQLWGVKNLRTVERRSGLIPTSGPVDCLGRGRVLLIGDAAGLVSPVTGGGIHTALQFGRRAAQLVSDYLFDRGPHPLAVFEREIPRYRLKLALRAAMDIAPPNFAINAVLMTRPMRALAQRLYFHSRRGDQASFESWMRKFEANDYEPAAPVVPPAQLRSI